MKILLVEDDEERADELKKYIQSKTVSVLVATDGYDALQLLKTNKVDLIISDANMPFMDGYILAKNVKKDFKTTPFFMYSSRYLPESNRELALEMGADKCLKSIKPEEIKNEVMAYLETI